MNRDFLKLLDNTNSFRKKIDLCNNTLQKLGVGSSRIVYDFGDNKVLKLAKNSKGLAQNSLEWDMYTYSGEIELLNITYECADDDSYVIAEKANKITKNKFVQLTHIPNVKDIYELREVINNCLRVYFYPRNSNPHLTDEQIAYYNDLNENNDFMSSLVTLINDFRIQLNDLLRPANLGIINENGKEKLVIIDYGFNDDVARRHYNQKHVGMYENFNEQNSTSDVALSLINQIPKGNTFHDKYTPSYYNELKKDIQTNGIKEPITLKYYYENNTLELGEGHHRLQIANELNLKTIPVQIKVIYEGKNNTSYLKSSDKYKVFQAPKKLDIENYEKRNYFPTYINPSEIGLNQSLINENKNLKLIIESLVKKELRNLLNENMYNDFMKKEQTIFSSNPSYEEYIKKILPILPKKDKSSIWLFNHHAAEIALESNKLSQAKKHIDLAIRNNIFGNSITNILDFIINNKGTKKELKILINNKITDKIEKETALQLFNNPKYGGILQ